MQMMAKRKRNSEDVLADVSPKKVMVITPITNRLIAVPQNSKRNGQTSRGSWCSVPGE